MLVPRIIPCLDVDAGRVVKGVRFQGLRDAGDPVESARTYQQQGADEIVILDVSATPEGRDHNLEVVAAVREALSIPLTVGGGVRSGSDAASFLEAGADKVGVNTAAVKRPNLIEELSITFGAQCTVLAVDAARRDFGWEVVIESGRTRTGIDVIDWCVAGAKLGAGEILLTSWDRDGTRQGYDLELVAKVSDAVSLPVIASGGADHPQHLAEAIERGASAVLVASILHDGDLTVEDLKTGLSQAGIEVRP
jgi:imidazoleglycerol phosphate synthase cyclase subunit